MDVFGATLETTAAAGALYALERSLRWLALWIAALVALSLTRIQPSSSPSLRSGSRCANAPERYS